MRCLVMVELLDSDGKLDRLACMTVCNDLERAQVMREYCESYYGSHGYAVSVNIYTEEELLKALNRR